MDQRCYLVCLTISLVIIGLSQCPMRCLLQLLALQLRVVLMLELMVMQRRLRYLWLIVTQTLRLQRPIDRW
jgi:hypothetical protein